MVTADSLDDCRSLLISAGLSPSGVLKSTGVARHLERAEQGQVSRDTLVRYAVDLKALCEQSSAGGTAIPVDFWDVPAEESVAQRRKGAKNAEQDEYAVVHGFCQPQYTEYVRLLGRCYGHLCEFKGGRNGNAVATALMLLRETTAYVCAGHCIDMASSCPAAKPEQQAIFLWQQIVAGSNRQVPYIHRDAYTHGTWGRFNVVEMWRYGVGSKVSVDEVWGLSGFSEPFIGDATNTNQIEHMAITALAQMVLGIPAVLLDVLEELEWMLRKGTLAASRADERLNRAVARHFRPLFRLEDPGPACEALEKALAAS